MDNRPYIKWYAEKLQGLLEQDPNNPQMLELYREVSTFVNSCRVEAQVPPGIHDDNEQ